METEVVLRHYAMGVDMTCFSPLKNHAIFTHIMACRIGMINRSRKWTLSVEQSL